MFVTLFWFLLFSYVSLRMQKECIPRYNIGARHHLKLPKGVRFLFFHLGNRRKNLTAAVILQCIAYIYLIICLCVCVGAGDPECYERIDRGSIILLLFILVYVCAVDFFYRIDARRNRNRM